MFKLAILAHLQDPDNTVYCLPVPVPAAPNNTIGTFAAKSELLRRGPSVQQRKHKHTQYDPVDGKWMKRETTEQGHEAAYRHYRREKGDDEADAKDHDVILTEYLTAFIEVERSGGTHDGHRYQERNLCRY